MLRPPQTNTGTSLKAPKGTFQAVCYGVWDIGLHEREWQGKKKIIPQVKVAFEINEMITEGSFAGKRYAINKTYTFSLGTKTSLAKDIESWLNIKLTDEQRKDFDLETLIGKNCMISIKHNDVGGKVYANIDGILPIMKGMPLMTPENPSTPPQWVLDIKEKSISPAEAHNDDANDTNDAIDDSVDGKVSASDLEFK